jgi:hypothetical protein
MLQLDRMTLRTCSLRNLFHPVLRRMERRTVLASPRRPHLFSDAVPELSQRSLAKPLAPTLGMRRQRAWKEHSKRGGVAMCVRIAPILTLCLWSSGCGLIMVGQPVEPKDFTSQDNAEENLKAIRAMLADQRSRHASSAVKPSDASSVPVPPSTESKSEVEPHSTLNPVTPSSASSSVNADAPAKLPWTPPSVSRPSPPDRPVPAYTIPAPVGPDYSGSIRCVPDGMGGQRCVAR